jgi:hypothetical protein
MAVRGSDAPYDEVEEILNTGSIEERIERTIRFATEAYFVGLMAASTGGYFEEGALQKITIRAAERASEQV